MQSNQQIDLNDLISSESYVYSVSNISDKRDSYQASQVVNLIFPSGAYVLDCNQVHLMFDSSVTSPTTTNPKDGCYYPRQPEDFFQVSNLEINGVQLVQQISQGRNLFCNWLKNSLTPYKPEQQSVPMAGLFAVTGTGVVSNYTGKVETKLSYEPQNLIYNGVNTATTNISSIMAYNQAQLSASRWRQKQYNIQLNAGDGAVTSENLPANNDFSANIIKLADISQEFSSLGLVNMCSTTIQMQLRFNDIQRVLSSGAHGSVLTNATLITLGDDIYSLSNLCLYFKTMQIKPNLIAQAKMLMNAPRPILTIYQNIKPLENLVTNQKISVNTSNLYYAVIFLQPNLNDKKTVKTAPFPINYNAGNNTADDFGNFNQNFNNLRYGTYEDSLEWKHNALTIDINGRQYKQSIISVGNRDLKSWIDANNAVYQCTGQYLNITLNQFLNNRFFAIIPLSPNQYPDTINTDSAISLNIMLDLSSKDDRQAVPTNMQMVTFVVGSKILLDNCSRLE